MQRLSSITVPLASVEAHEVIRKDLADTFSSWISTSVIVGGYDRDTGHYREQPAIRYDIVTDNNTYGWSSLRRIATEAGRLTGESKLLVTWLDGQTYWVSAKTAASAAGAIPDDGF